MFYNRVLRKHKLSLEVLSVEDTSLVRSSYALDKESAEGNYLSAHGTRQGGCNFSLPETYGSDNHDQGSCPHSRTSSSRPYEVPSLNTLKVLPSRSHRHRG